MIEGERELAWIGDAVLALWARRRLLELPGLTGWPERAAAFRDLTSNQALGAFGEPTRVEARLGQLYREGGPEAVFAWLDERLWPRFLARRARAR